MTMTDQPPGPGYWKASDGQWYPPQAAPGATPPSYGMPGGHELDTPKKKSHKLRWTLLAIAAIVVVAGIAEGSNSSNSSSSSGNSASDSSPSAPASGIATSSNNTSHPPQADVDEGWKCTSDDVGMKATGTVTNHSSKTSTYTIHFDFTDSTTGVRAGDAEAIVNEVQSGQTASFEATSFTNASGSFKCALTSVDRNGF